MDIISYLLGKQAGGGTPSVLEEKNVTVTTNGETTITPSSGYNGISKVNLTTNVSQPSGKIDITQNGTNIDVSNYATADVSVKYTPRYFNNFSFANYQGTELNYEVENASGIVSVANFINQIFNGCSNLLKLDLSSWNNNIATAMNQVFQNCSSLTEVDLSGFEGNNVTTATFVFANCTSLQKIDIRKFTFTNLTNSQAFFGSGESTGVPNNCLIIVKDNTQKQWINTNFSRLTNVKTVAEYEG